MTVQPAPIYVPAKEIVVGDRVLAAAGWRRVVDVWTSLGIVHAALTADGTAMWKPDKEVEIARRPKAAAAGVDQ